MDFEKARFNMVEQQIRPWDVLNTQLLDLLFHVKRENFVADNQKAIAFVDTELPLPNGSRMLQPKMEARILQELNIAADEKILEIGTGSGYLAALLASVGKHVYSLDIDANMTALAKANLARAGIQNVTLVTANGVGGLPTNAPFDVIVVGGALPSVPEELTSQLAVALSQEYPEVYAGVGFHPSDCSDFVESIHIPMLRDWCALEKTLAIGQ